MTCSSTRVLLLTLVACDIGRSSVVEEETDTDVDEATTMVPDGEPPPVAPGGYYVLGNTIFTADGEPHRFRGVARPSLEWNPVGEMHSAQDYELIAAWNANVVRIPLNQGFWREESVVHNTGYRDTIDQNIAWAHAAGMTVILDLHWSDRGDDAMPAEQQRMADANSIAFWDSVASRYQDDGQVLFELYNEPHDVSWAVWRDGGLTADGYDAVGMQQLYDTVRATGAHNLVLIGGLRWAYDLSGVADNRVDGYNIVYVSHPYDYPDKQPSAWERDWGYLAETDPVMVTEFGSFGDCDPTYSNALLDYAEEIGASWTAWAWYPGGCDFPALIEDWTGTPTALGQAVKDRL